MTSSADRVANRDTAGGLVATAARMGARLVVLPERWAHIDGSRTLEGAEALEGPSLSAAREWARDLGIHLLAGSIAEGADVGRAFNTSVLIDPAGALAAVYRKIHLFDVEVGGREYRESAQTAPGAEPVTGEVDGHVVGMSVCYDLRFPELYRALVDRGAEILAVPAAFTETTGRDHWEPLLRARAIENQVWLLGVNRVGQGDGLDYAGDSALIDPLGETVAEAAGQEALVAGEVDAGRVQELRARLSFLADRKPELYGKL